MIPSPTPSPPRPRVGYTCQYVPWLMIDAAGFEPYRILPMGKSPDSAGRLLHDNLCPTVKRIVDRLVARDVPPLRGLVVPNSCDAMRRLGDAASRMGLDISLAAMDLPVLATPAAARRLAEELETLRGHLARWAGSAVSDEALAVAVMRHNRLARGVAAIDERRRRGSLHGGAARQQALVVGLMTSPYEECLALLRDALGEPETASSAGVPIVLVGNVMPSPEELGVLESSGLRVVHDDLCTGRRAFEPFVLSGEGAMVTQLARALLDREPCARTMTGDPSRSLATRTVEACRSTGARGVVIHVAKFCDPYLLRLPALATRLAEEGIPTLTVEGDASVRSLGQQRTRFEAFQEMIQ